MRVIVLDSLEEIAAKSQEYLLEYLDGPSIDPLRPLRIAVSGGSTFAALFRHWVPAVSRRAAAGAAPRFFAVDERKVPFDDPQCNWKNCYEDLLLPAGLAEQKAHYVISAAQYAEMLEAEFGAGPIIFDRIFLGMGEDGHTASLFPGKASLSDTESIALDIHDSPKPPPARVTLGLGTIRACKKLVTVALGAGKADMVRRLRAGDMSLPITLAMRGHPDAVLLLDRAAAGM